MESTACHHYELRTAFKPAERPKLPCMVLTGFLGSGKTTLLEHIIKNKSNLRIGAVVNDAADLNIDRMIVERTIPQDGSFGDAVRQLLQKDELSSGAWLDYLVVETSGVSDPAPLVATLDQKFGVMHKVRLDSVVAVVDSSLVIKDLLAGSDVDPILHRQQDLVLDADRELLTNWCTEVCPSARMIPSAFAQVALPELLDVAVAEGPVVVGHETQLGDTAWQVSVPTDSRRQAAPASVPHIHADEQFQTVTVQLPAPAQLQLSSLLEWLQRGVDSNTVLRIKGFASLAELCGQAYLLQLSGRSRWTLEPCPQHGAQAGVQLVAIGKGMDQQLIRQELEALCKAHAPSNHTWQPPDSSVLEQLRGLERAEEVPASAVVRFEPMRKFGKLPKDASSMAGMSLDEANQLLIRAVNMSAGQVVLASCEGIDDSGERVVGILLPLTTEGAVLDVVWTVLEEKAQWMLDTYFKALLSCACGW